MKLQDILNSDKKIAISCRGCTDEQIEKVREIIAKKCGDWSSPLGTMLSTYRNKLCISPKGGGDTKGYCSLNFYIQEGYTIIPASEFIAANTEEQPIGWKVGDTLFMKDSPSYEFCFHKHNDVYRSQLNLVDYTLEEINNEVKSGNWIVKGSRPVLFTTHDGVDIREGDVYYTVWADVIGNPYDSPTKQICPEQSKYFDRTDLKQFSTEQAAKDWIEQQKAEQPKEETLIPFDYDKAKENKELVRYRNGEKPLEWHHFKDAISQYSIISINPYGVIVTHSIGGYTHNFVGSKPWDLMLVDDTPEVVWFNNVYADHIGGTDYDSLNAAIEEENSLCIAVVKFTVKGTHVTSQIVHTYKK